MPIDPLFTSKVAHKNRRNRKYTEDELNKCRALLALDTGLRKDTYVSLKQDLYAKRAITPYQQLFVDKIDGVFNKHARRWSKSAEINADVNRIIV